MSVLTVDFLFLYIPFIVFRGPCLVSDSIICNMSLACIFPSPEVFVVLFFSFEYSYDFLCCSHVLQVY